MNLTQIRVSMHVISLCFNGVHPNSRHYESLNTVVLIRVDNIIYLFLGHANQ